MEQGFIQLPREFESDPFWRSLTSQWQRVFIFILFKLAYKEHDFYVGTKLFKILPGQYATSERRFVDDFNSTCPKSDHISRTSLRRFQRDLKTLHILDHIILGTSVHTITLITLTHPVLCKQFERNSGPQEKMHSGPHSGPHSNRIRTTHKENEECKDYSSTFKKENEKEKRDDQKIISLSFSSLKEEEIFEGVSAYASSLGFPIDENVLIRWISNFGEGLIKESLGQLIKKKDFKGNHEAYLETILGNKLNFNKNLSLAEVVKEHHSWEGLIITKQYCYVELGNEYMFKWPHERFRAELEKKFNRIYRNI
jgi:hypothetical protein